MEDQRKPATRRRWFQFNLRTLLVIVLVVAAYFGGRIPVLRQLEATKQKMSAVEKKAQEAMMQALVEREKAEAQRLAAEYQLQATKALIETQSHETQPAADSENGALTEAASNRSEEDGD
jgi:hypothetical protein